MPSAASAAELDHNVHGDVRFNPTVNKSVSFLFIAGLK